jgi:AcrR family transcriptional regulator
MKEPENETRQKLLDVGERLFSERGYTSVRLRDIADALGIKHAALYYYFPEGKEQLYIAVMERNLHRHRAGMEQAVAEAGPELRDQLRAVAHWLLTQPPVNLARMTQSDLPALQAAHAERLGLLAFDSMRMPLTDAIAAAKERGIVVIEEPGLAAICFTALIQTIHGDDHPVAPFRDSVVEQIIDLFLNGLLKR